MGEEMKSSVRINLRRSANLLLVALVLLACNLLLPRQAGPTSLTEGSPSRPAGAATGRNSLAIGPATPTGVTAGQAGATAGPTAGSGRLAVSDSYRLQVAKGMLGFSLTAGPGKVWIGTGGGAIQEVDAQSGAFGQSILLTPGAINATNVYPILKLGFDGQYVWALADPVENHEVNPHVFAINSDSGAIAHQWDLNSREWKKDMSPDSQIARYFVKDLGISPGRIWVDNHVIDTQTFQAKHVGMIGGPHFAYNGQGWMWMTGVGPEACDGLDFFETDNPSQDHYQCRYPFLNHASEGYSNVGDNSPVVLAGDKVWIGGGWSGTKPTYTLEAHWADMDQLMQETKPLVSVPLPDSYQEVKMLFAGNFLWLLWTGGEKVGFLYQLDPQTGATINSLDVAVDKAPDEFVADTAPQDIATEGDNLWILMRFHLLRIKLP
jgi:hypothetical protein